MTGERTRVRSILGLLAIATFAASCEPKVQGLLARGMVAGKPVVTRVDSEEARDLLASRADRGAPAAARRARIERARQQIHAAGAAPEALSRVAREYSPDLATLLFAEELLGDERNARMQARYLREVERLGTGRPNSPVTGERYAILFVPGWMYLSHPENGAGFERQLALAARMGIEAERIPIEENAPVERNAALIAEEIRRRQGDGRRYILASASKAGAEVALALSILAEEETAHVVAWANIGGALGGSPLADEALLAPRCWGVVALFGWRKGGLDGLRSLVTAKRRARLAVVEVPEHVLVVNYVPLPLSGDVTGPARSGYESMRFLGPNDGIALTTDEILPGGATIVEAGLDHFMAAPDIDRRTAALITVLVGELEGG